MIRKIFGDNVTDYLMRFKWLYKSYVAFRHALAVIKHRLSLRSPYRSWMINFEKRLPAINQHALDFKVYYWIDTPDQLAQLQKLKLSRPDLAARIVVCGHQDIVESGCCDFEMTFVLSPGQMLDVAVESDSDTIVFAHGGVVLSSFFELGLFSLKSEDFDLAYFDNDKLNDRGRRIEPFFKPAFNLGLLAGADLIGGCFVVKKSVLSKLSRSHSVGWSEWELSIFHQASINELKVRSVRYIGFHRTQFSPKLSVQQRVDFLNKLDSGEQEFECLSDVVTDIRFNHHSPTVSIVIPTRDHVDDLKKCVDSVLERTRYSNYEIIIVDNQSECLSTLSYLSKINQHSKVKVLTYDAPFNYSLVNNFAVEQSHGEVVLLLNNDTEIISSDWLDRMVGWVMNPSVGCVGAKLLYPDGTIQHAGVALGPGGYAGHSHRFLGNLDSGYFNLSNISQQLTAVTAACLAIRRSVWDEVEGLDAAFKVAYNDVDLCLRVDAIGYSNIYCAGAELFHFESKSRGQDDTPEKIARFATERQLLRERWSKIIEDDRFYSPHLTRNREDFSIRQGHYELVKPVV